MAFHSYCLAEEKSEYHCNGIENTATPLLRHNPPLPLGVTPAPPEMSKINKISSIFETKQIQSLIPEQTFCQNHILGEAFFSKTIENSPYSKNAKNH